MPVKRERRPGLAARLRLRGARYALWYDADGIRTLFGTPSTRFVNACAEILHRRGTAQAWVAERGRGARAGLIFNAELDEATRQRIRNAWTPPRRPTSGGSGMRA